MTKYEALQKKYEEAIQEKEILQNRIEACFTNSVPLEQFNSLKRLYNELKEYKEDNYSNDIEYADKPHVVMHWTDGKSMTIPVESLYEFDTNLSIATKGDQYINIPLSQVRWYSVNNYTKTKEK